MPYQQFRASSLERPMRPTAESLKRASLTTSFRGYDQKEVHTLLNAAAEQFSAMEGDILRLIQIANQQRVDLDEHERARAGVRESLIAAQVLSSDIASRAKEAANTVLHEAETSAQSIIAAAEAEARIASGAAQACRLEAAQALRGIACYFESAADLSREAAANASEPGAHHQTVLAELARVANAFSPDTPADTLAGLSREPVALSAPVMDQEHLPVISRPVLPQRLDVVGSKISMARRSGLPPTPLSWPTGEARTPQLTSTLS